MKRIIDLPALSVRADVTGVAGDREVSVRFATDTPVPRQNYDGSIFNEVLSMNAKHVRLERLNNGAPVLGSHRQNSLSDVLGVVVEGSARVAAAGATARIRFSKRPDVEPFWQDVRDGIIRNVSVGYRVHRFEETTAAKGDQRAVWTAIDWEPFEVSLVAIPADHKAGVGRSEPGNVTRCEVITQATAIEEDRQRILREAMIEVRSEYLRKECGYSDADIAEARRRYNWDAA